ncbi:LysR substrate-binding domain-containing protein [Roseovarius aquimarinus]|uniref:LysR substrate-binding domain-containing protein n=1 Tax=Roseovarius aquimarinus TaxID=1229156 RepID=A0ABW7I6N6_9RHOB
MPLRYTLRQLEYFVAVGDTGSIAAAAQRANVSSPSISAGVAQLEEELGVRLFVRRHAHGLTPTAAGRTLLIQARQTLSEAGALRDMAGELAGSIRGPLAIGCLSTFAQVVLPGLRQSFAAKHDAVRISQIEADQAGLFSLLRQAEIDLALTYDLDLPSDLAFHAMLDLPPLVALSPAHPLAAKAALSAADLAPHPMVLLDLPHSADYFLSFFAEAGLRARIVERTRDMGVMRGLVANGFGYAIVNMRPPGDLAPDGKPLRFVPLSGGGRAMRLGLLTGAGEDRPGLQGAFLEHAGAWLRQEGAPLLRVRGS